MIEKPCPGCFKPCLYPDYEGAPWLCPDCYESLLERTAKQIDPTWDETVMNSSERLAAVLGKVYCWPPWREGWQD